MLAASAVNNSKRSRSITLPSAESQSQLYCRVLRDAALRPLQVSYVEAQSIRHVFARPPQQPLRLGSFKGNIGHLEAASGVAAVSKVLLMLQHRLIPPQANFSVPNSAISPLAEAGLEIPVRLEPWKGPFRAAMVKNYGASGTNAAMVLCQAPLTRRTLTANTLRRHPILITAHTLYSLRKYCRVLLDSIEAEHAVSGETLAPSIAFSLAQRQNHSLGHRVVFSASSVDELKIRLHTQIKNEAAEPQMPQGGPKPVVLVFAGQTGRPARLSRAAYVGSLLLQRHLDHCDRTLQTLGFYGLYPHLFGEELVDDLVHLHCMQFSIQYSVAKS